MREIDAFMYRRAGVYVPPGIGRTALGSFSSGNDLVQLFLDDADNRKHPFYLNVLKEVYAFEAPQKDDWVKSALRWAQAGSSEDKVVQIYTQGAGKTYGDLLDGSLPAAPFVQVNDNGLRTVGVLPIPTWGAARKSLGVTRTGFDEVHQLISALMLTDALRRSKF